MKKDTRARLRLRTTATAKMQRLKMLGCGEIVYLRKLSRRDAKKLFPEVRDIPLKKEIYCVFHANGSGFVITDSVENALNHASEGEVQLVTVH